MIYQRGIGYQVTRWLIGVIVHQIKLLAMMGGIIGWKGVLFTIFVGSLAGTMAGLAVMLQSRKGMKLAVPFGPFLSIGGITYIFFGMPLIAWYFNLLG